MWRGKKKTDLKARLYESETGFVRFTLQELEKWKLSGHI